MVECALFTCEVFENEDRYVRSGSSHHPIRGALLVGSGREENTLKFLMSG